MRGDFTRITFLPHQLKHFSQVLHLQGRLLSDADLNEQTDILLRYLRVLARDLIGHDGGPTAASGFAIRTLTVPPAAPTNDFAVEPGRYYVDGILCEQGTPVRVPSTSGGGNTLTVAGLLVDGVEFQVNQFVTVTSEAPAASYRARITGVDRAQRTLTIQPIESPPPSFTPAWVARFMTYTTQPDYPLPDPAKLENLTPGRDYVAYLDVWERFVTFVEDDSIREVALNGPDTAGRAKVVYQVKLLPVNADGTLPNMPPAVGPCDLRARATRTQAAPADPCVVSPDARYRGAENQLYRVEIHLGGSARPTTSTTAAPPPAATFKWSRENGSVVFPIRSLATDSTAGTTMVVLETLGRDARLGLTPGDWVEIVDDDYVLQNRAEPLLQVASIDPSTLRVTLTGTPGSNAGQSPAKHPLLRRWDQKAGDPQEGGLELEASSHTAFIMEGTGETGWLDIEDGIQIQFQPGGRYRSGDYWFIPARVATGDVEWPTDTDATNKPIPIAMPPHGVEHRYAPVATITVGGGGTIGAPPKDLRRKFDPLAKP